eukprot:1441591-Prymnesium_polylepis.1
MVHTPASLVWCTRTRPLTRCTTHIWQATEQLKLVYLRASDTGSQSHDALAMVRHMRATRVSGHVRAT